MPALSLCGAFASAGYGVFEWTVNSPPPPEPVIIRPAAAPFTLNQVLKVIARKHGVRQGFVRSIIAAESAFRQDVVSPRGAVGLMQLMPDTARDMGVDPTVAEQNVEGGTKYVRWLIGRYGSSGPGLERAIAAYNAGPGTVDKYKGIPPFRETRDYVKRVLTYYRQFERVSNRAKPAALSAALDLTAD